MFCFAIHLHDDILTVVKTAQKRNRLCSIWWIFWTHENELLEKQYEGFIFDFALLVGADNIDAILNFWRFWPSCKAEGFYQLSLLNVSCSCGKAMNAWRPVKCDWTVMITGVAIVSYITSGGTEENCSSKQSMKHVRVLISNSLKWHIKFGLKQCQWM